jgi:hypothetical protein
MLMLTELSGFASRSLSEVLVDRTLGTNIGNMTVNGGLAAAFDGTTNQGTAACAADTTGTGYVGKTHTVPRVPGRVTVHGSNDAGYSSGGNGSCTITWYGKKGTAPANATDGTVLGSITFTDTSNESTGRDITTQDQNGYDHWWVTVVVAANVFVAELVMYELL